MTSLIPPGVRKLFGKDDELPKEVAEKVKELFEKVDKDKDGQLTMAEAADFWTHGKLGKFGKMSARAMFNEVDGDGDQKITYKEFVDFWKNVRNNSQHQYSDEEIIEELTAMCEGEAWRDWDDGRSTTADRDGNNTNRE